MKRISRFLQGCGAFFMMFALFGMQISSNLLADTIATPASSPSPPAVTAEDLSNLKYTATGTLEASFVAPAPDEASPITATQVVVSTQRGAGVELRAGDAIVDSKHLGKRTVNSKTGETQYFFYGVPLAPGPNTLTATPLGADDERGPTASVTVYGPAEASSVKAEFGQHLVADGKTAVPLNVTVLDRFGHASLPAQRVHVAILSGDVHFVDVPKANGTDSTPVPSASPNAGATPPASGAREADVALPVGAYFSLRVQPGVVAGPFELELRAGNAYVRKTYYVDPFVRGAFVNGIVSAGTGIVPGAVDGDALYDGGGARRERLAMYGTGGVGKSLLTVAYESQNRLSPVSSFGPFVDDPNERPYLTYGDASQIVAPYHSEDHLYARVDRGRSSAMWGQYQANIGPTDAGSYQQLLSGGKVDLALGHDARARVTGFTARNDQAFVSQILPVSGLGQLLQPLHPQIVVSSDVLQLVTLDRSTGLVLHQLPLLRNVDYTIDYATGTLRFINIPLPYDAQFNPQVISLQYEYQGPGVQSQTTGGQFNYDLSPDHATKLLLSYVNDATGSQNFSLAGEALTRSWNGGSVRLSRATSVGNMPNAGNLLQLNGAKVANSGSAYSVAFDERARGDAVALAYQSTTAGYDDPFGGLSTPGTNAYRALWNHGTQARGQLSVSYSGQQNHGIGAESREGDVTLQFIRSMARNLTGTLGFTQHQQRVAGGPAASPAPGVALANTTQTQAQAALDYHLPKHFGVSFSEAMTLAGSDVGSTQPSQTAIEASYDLPKQGRVFARELLSSQPSATFANSTSNLNIGTGSTRSLQIGVEQPLSGATSVSSQYVVDQTGSGLNVYDAAGVDERLRLSKTLGANLQVQAANAVGNGAAGFTLLSGALNYAGAPGGFRSSLSYQDRTGNTGGATLAAALAGRVTPNVSAVGFIQHAYGNGIAAIDDRLSLAYRPASNDRLISLFDYTRTNGALLSGEASNVISFEELFHATPRLELASRVAYKMDGGGDYAAKTTLYALRARQTIAKTNDIGAEVRTIDVPGGTGARQTEVVLEAGKTLGRAARIGVGYNVSGSVDPTLVGQAQRHGFYVTVTSLIDRIFGWGKP